MNQISYYAYGLQYREHHTVLLLAASIEDIAARKVKEYAPDLVMFKRAMEILKTRNYVSIIDNGVRGFISK